MLRLLQTLFFLISAAPFWASAQVPPAELSLALRQRMERIPEFKFIQQTANKLGVKVYLFGGTASAFAHYVRWDLERQKGDTKYQAERFDYDFTNIYRGNQDLDIVVDGSLKDAEKLENILHQKYPHFVGDKTAWEVRLLRDEKGDKLPLLDDPDFLNQHTDTNSTGMIAINPGENDFVFRDLFDWDSVESRFLNDVAQAQIEFLYSKNHEQTARYKDGKNPPIFAAIRYLAKLTQYEVEGNKEDLKTIQKIIDATDWKEVRENAYVKHKLEEFGKKILLNAPNSEYAWNLLESLNLRKKLIEMDNNQINTAETLSWWMNKEPLRTQPLGTEGRTAKEIFGKDEIIVTHETNSFVAYENITRSSQGIANAFISREGVEGEAAAYGDGFYTQVGLAGARGTNLSIRFKLHPEAREGVDFLRPKSSNLDFVIIKNKSALTLIQENLNISLVDYLNLLKSGGIGVRDKGLIEKFNRKFGRISIDSKEFKEAVKLAKASFFIAEDFPKKYTYKDFNENIDSLNKLITLWIKKRDEYYKSLELDKIDFFNNPNWLAALIEKGEHNWSIALTMLSEERWAAHPWLIAKLIEKGDADRALAIFVFSKKVWTAHPWLIAKLIENKSVHLDIVNFLSGEHWGEHPDLVELLITKSNQFLRQHLIKNLLNLEHWKKHQLRFVEKLIEAGDVDQHLIEQILVQDKWINHPQLIEKLIEGGNDRTHQLLANHVLSRKGWEHHPHLVEKLIEKGNPPPYRQSEHIAWYILSQEHWEKHPQLLEQLIKTGHEDYRIAVNALSQEHWTNYPELLIKFMDDNPNKNHTLKTHVFSKEYWTNHSELKDYVQNTKVSFENLTERLKEISFEEWRTQKNQLKAFSCKSLL